nr:potassium channel family protein [Sedimentibacter sp.]
MNLKYPRKSNFGWVSEIRNQHFVIVLVKLLSFYLIINLCFAIVYYAFKVLLNGTQFFDYIYFSFVTSLAIGYGDFVPVKIVGKILVIMHSCITTMYFALMVSILSIKMFYPGDSIRFSKKIIYNPTTDKMIFRVINTNREALINPEVRISVTEHNIGDEIAGVFNLLEDCDITYLGRHDLSYTFKNSFENFNLIKEANKANEYNKEMKSFKSRFRINISITGNYGLQQIAIHKKYFADEIVIGESYRPITYNEEGYRKKGGIRYYKIKNFWNDFESIEDYSEKNN